MDERPDDAEVRLPRRDEPIPAEWVHETTFEERIEGFVGKPQPPRAPSAARTVVIVLVALFLLGSIADLIFVVVTKAGVPEFAFTFLVTGVMQVLGWAFIVYLWRRR